MSWIQSAFGSKISPVILFIIVLLAVVFFICAVLHLLIRFLLKQRSPQPHISPNHHEVSNSSAFQRQLQQLFHLHDSGLDQAYIDALPVFLYKDIVMGSKEPFDCAVCLCEFSQEDSLRLLPVCSHAFHIGCIDTWLLSNSTCPLCRGVILSFENPVFFFDEFKENEEGMKPREDENTSAVINEKRVFSVRLGKFRSTNNISNSVVEENQENEKSEVIGESSNSNSNMCNIDARRCYSMGSYQYVVADSELQVALCPSGRDRGSVKGRGGGGGGQNGHFTSEGDDGNGKKINKGAKGESFSVSKIWMWSRKGKFHSSTEATTHYPNAIDVSLP